MLSNSSINWCENDYIYSNYIAEFWNTLTGLTLCAMAIYLYSINNQQKMYNLTWSNILLFIVGIGTILFHSTLLYLWQLFDEIPMLLLVIEYYRLLSNTTFIQRMPIFKLTYFKMYYTIPIIITSYYIHPQLHIGMFQGTLTIYILLVLYTCYSFNLYLNKLFYDTHTFYYIEHVIKSDNNFESEENYIFKLKNIRKRISYTSIDKNTSYKTSDKTSDKTSYKTSYKHTIDKHNSINTFKTYVEHKAVLRAYSIKGFGLLIFSLLIWNIDNHFCHKIEFLKLHALWHIITSIGMYYCNEIMRMYIILNSYI